MAASSVVHRPAAARVQYLREAALPGERFAVKAVLPVLQRSLAQAQEHHALLRFRAAVEYPGAVLPAEAVRWVRQAARPVHPATHTIAAAVPAAVRWVRQAARPVHPAAHTIAAAVPAAVRWVRQAVRPVRPAAHTIAEAVPAAATTAVAVRALPEAVIAEVRPEAVDTAAVDTAVAAARQGAAAVAAGKRSVSVNLTFLKV